MKNKRRDERFLDSIEYIDESIVNAVMAKLKPNKSVHSERFKRRNRWLVVGVAIAACAVLFSVAIPTTTTIITHSDISRLVGAGNESDELQKAPEYDGSRGLKYVVSEDGESASFISFGTCTDEDIVVASHYNGLPVVEMLNQPYYDAKNHYDNFAYGNEYAKTLTIPDTVKRVSGAIIDQCPNLERVYIGAAVEVFATPFFNTPSKVVSIEVSPDNKNYSDAGNCLVDLRTKRLVWGCNTSVIPDDGSIEVIGAVAFMNAKGFSAEYLPEGIKTIEPNAFTGCDGLISLRLPSTLEKIWGSTFVMCENLESVDLNGYSVIEPAMFAYCTSLKEVKGSENITFVDSSAFRGCTSLTIDLSHALQKIEDCAFAFLYQNGEAVINFSGTIAEWNSIEKSDSWKTNSWFVDVNCTDGVLNLRGK